MKRRASPLKSIGLGLAIIAVLVVYAYGFQVTKVNFGETRSEIRLTQLTRILRALAHPAIIEYETEDVHIDMPFYLPCPEGELPAYEPDTSGPYITSTPPCGESRETITVEGFNLWPNTKGALKFIPPSGASLPLGNVDIDSNGYFKADANLPYRQPVEEAQILRITVKRNIGTPRFTTMAKITWDKIVETVFLALLATTIGTGLAIPVSFIAARNLMVPIKSPLTNVTLSIIGWPLGIWIGLKANSLIVEKSIGLITSFSMTAASVVISPLVIFGILKLALPQVETEKPTITTRLIRIFAILVSAILGIFTLTQISLLGLSLGKIITGPLGKLGFLGGFVTQLGDVLQMVTPALVALSAGAAIGGILGRLGQHMSDYMSPAIVKISNFFASALALAMIFALVGAGINWFYQINNLVKTLWIPAGVGAFLGLSLAAWASPKEPLPIGAVVYFIIRTILNATRSVEPLVMVIVFVVWVGIGPFAGALALALHTIAALAKLYSEQVESILPGPLEAITATGANRLQTIAYAVIPQIIPPYISFTMYRWDINVRMSTIIGFAGGGGIGFLLQQNINLLDYRGASVQMLAIAIVVATMDYVSSVIRERYV
ncbi:MAG: ABC transporter permease subunit [Chloroflexota bacterium]